MTASQVNVVIISTHKHIFQNHNPLPSPPTMQINNIPKDNVVPPVSNSGPFPVITVVLSAISLK
jgi:hypothetical protein